MHLNVRLKRPKRLHRGAADPLRTNHKSLIYKILLRIVTSCSSTPTVAADVHLWSVENYGKVWLRIKKS